METKQSLQERLKKSFLLYGEEVAINRSIPDARDGLKLGLRQGLYAQYTNNLTYKYPFKKALKSVAAAMSQSYYHGDAAMYDTFIRCAKPWVYRYMLEEAQGAYGSPCAPDDHSASRYVEMRSSEIADCFFKNLEKNTINDWYNNYDDTEKIPGVLPSIGFWGIINGVKGIAVGFTSSISPTNLIEVNNALIKLLNDPNISDNEIYCAPDYPSGCCIINGEETKQSILNGQGEAIKMRALIEYDNKKNALIITHIPWGVFTNTIIGQIKELIDNEQIHGIEKVIDYTKTNAEICVYLSKNANPNEIKKLLFAKTSAQSSCSVRTVMLDNGRFPKVFTWKQALQAHIDHEKEVYRKGFEFDLAKIEHRIHIIDGLLICLATIDEVISTIKNSTSTAEASMNLQHNFLLDDEQAKAVLALKLASLAKLEVKKLEDEKIKLTEEANRIKIILENEKEFNQQLINGWNEISKKFGDSRRTKILIEESTEEKPEKIIKEITILINLNGEYMVKEGKSNLKSFKKGKVVYKMNGTTAENYYIFSNLGRCYCVNGEKIFGEPTGKIQEFLKFEEKEEIVSTFSSDMEAKVAFITTKLGQIKKLPIEEIKSIKKDKAYIGLQEYDSVVDIKFGFGDEKIALASQDGFIVIFDGEIISTTKLPSKGILGIKLKELTDEVVSMALITDKTEYICSITTKGYIKKTKIDEYPITARGTKGRLVCKFNEDLLAEIIPFNKGDNICYSKVFNEINVEDIPVGQRTSRGIDILKM